MTEHKELPLNQIVIGDVRDVLKTFPDNSIDCCVTSPPYWGLRDYGTGKWIGGDPDCKHFRSNKVTDSNTTGQRKSHKKGGIGDSIYKDICKKCGAKRVDNQIGLEKTFEEYIDNLLSIFDEVMRVLKKEGTCFVVLGDTYGGSGMGVSYAGHTKGPNSILTDKLLGSMPSVGHVRGKYDKCLLMIPERFAIKMMDKGWILRNMIIWHKPSVMPASVKDRFTVDYEVVFMFVKSKKYFYEQQFERMKQCSVDRRDRAVSDHHKWAGGADGQSKHTMNQPRPNRKKFEESMGGSGTGFQGHSNYYGADGEPIGKRIGDSMYRNMRCVWSIPTQSFGKNDEIDHFAVFPERLVRPMIESGCPLSICKKCGKPRKRMYEGGSADADEKQAVQIKDHKNLRQKGQQPHTMHIRRAEGKGEPDVMRVFKGYSSCSCGAEFKRGIVLDPFAGTGTACYVAASLRRDYVGIELNPEYVEKLASKKMEDVGFI